MQNSTSILDKLEGFSVEKTVVNGSGNRGKIHPFIANIVKVPGYHDCAEIFRADQTDIKDQLVHIKYHTTAHVRKNKLEGSFEIVQAAKEGKQYIFAKWVPKAAPAKVEAPTGTEAEQKKDGE